MLERSVLILSEGRGFGLDQVEKFRKDFLLLMKNENRARNYAQARAWYEGAKKWRAYFHDFIFRRLVDDLKSHKYKALDGGLNLDPKWFEKWESDIRTAAWDLYVELLPPLQTHEEVIRAWADTPTPRVFNQSLRDALFSKFKGAVGAWARKVKRIARKVWKLLREFVDWVKGREASLKGPFKMKGNESFVEQFEGFRVKVVNHDPDSEMEVNAIRQFKRILKVYKARANKVFPWLVRYSLPWHLDFKMDLDEGGSYHKTYVRINPFYISGKKDDKKTMQVLAHEMGHHIFQKVMSKDQVDYWLNQIRGNWTELDLRDIVAKSSEKFHSFQDLKKNDPALYIQLRNLINNPIYAQLDIYSRSDVVDYLAGGGDPIFKVHKEVITGYAAKNPEEAFCEALGVLMGFGPKRLPDSILRWLKTLFKLRIQEQALTRTPLVILS